MQQATDFISRLISDVRQRRSSRNFPERTMYENQLREISPLDKRSLLRDKSRYRMPQGDLSTKTL